MKNFSKCLILMFLVFICINCAYANNEINEINGLNGLNDVGDYSISDDYALNDVNYCCRGDNNVVSNYKCGDGLNSDDGLSFDELNSDLNGVGEELKNSNGSKNILSNPSILSDSSSKIHKITQNNLDDYFDEDGYLYNKNVLPYDTIDFSGKIIGRDMIFQVPLVITSLSYDAKLINSTVQFDKVNDLSPNRAKVYNLNIENYIAGENGVILTFCSNIEIFNNTIYTEGSSGNPIRLLYSNNSHVHNNILRTSYNGFMNNSWLHSCIILGDSHFNNISSNDITVKESNGIYLSAISIDPSNYNVIFNNTVRSSSISNKTGLHNPSSWSYGIQVMGDYNKVLNNTVFNSFRGTSTDGHFNQIIGNNYFNLTGGYNEGNDGLEGADYAIYGSYSTIIINNTIQDSHIYGAAIRVFANSSVSGNVIKLNGTDSAILVDDGGVNVLIFNNSINFVSGEGIVAFGSVDNLNVYDNRIISDSGRTIVIKKRSSKSFPRNVTVRENWILSNNKDPFEFNNLDNYSAAYSNDINHILFIRNDTFFDYFADNGILKTLNESYDYILFYGEFSNLDIERIIIDRPLNVLGNGKISNIQFVIESDDVSISNMDISCDNDNPIITGKNINNLNLSANKFLSKSSEMASFDLNNVKNILMRDNFIMSDYMSIYLNNSTATIVNNFINVSADCEAICIVDGSLINASLNKIFTQSAYALNLTNTGSPSDSKNNVSNNHLATGLNENALVYYDSGCENNSIIKDNFGLKTVIFVNNNLSYVNRYPMIHLSLLDTENNPIANQKLKISLINQLNNLKEFVLFTDFNGDAFLEENLSESNYSYNVSFEGSGFYKSCNSLNNNLEVRRIETSLILSDIETYYGMLSFKVSLIGEDGLNLNGKTVYVDLGDKTYNNYTVNGVATFNLGLLDVGSYTIKSSFLGDDNSIKSNCSSKLTIKSMPTKLLSNNLVIYYQNGSSLMAYLNDIYNNPIAGKNLTISISGKKFYRVSDGNGKINLSINLIPKNYSATISFDGDGNYQFTSISVKVQVLVRPTKIIAGNLIKYYGDKKKYVFYLKDSNNNALASKKVSITINKKTYKRTTDKSGKVSILFNLPKKTYSAVIKFSASHFKSSTKKITVKVVNPIIKSKGSTVKKGKKLNIVFKTYDNKLIKKQKVYFKFRGKTYYVTTNSKGIASLNCNIKKGAYKLTAGFKSTNTYGKYTAAIVFKVK